VTKVTFQIAERVVAARAVSADHVATIPIGDAVVLLVADGAGNSSAGGVAAEALCARLASTVRDGGFDPDEEGSWAHLLAECDARLFGEGNGGETTAVALYLAPGRIVGASVGDSEAWLLEANGFYVLTEGQVRKPLVGSGRARPVAFRHATARGTLLLASDGLFKYAAWDLLRATLAREEDVECIAGAFCELPRMPSGALPDDVGLVVCRFDSV
jgi:PPM family protein phosphatase